MRADYSTPRVVQAAEIAVGDVGGLVEIEAPEVPVRLRMTAHEARTLAAAIVRAAGRVEAEAMAALMAQRGGR